MNILLSLAAESEELVTYLRDTARHVNEIDVGYRGLVYASTSIWDENWLRDARDPDDYFYEALRVNRSATTWLEGIQTTYSDVLILPNNDSDDQRISMFEVHAHPDQSATCLQAVAFDFPIDSFTGTSALRQIEGLRDWFHSSEVETSSPTGCCTDPSSGECKSEGCSGVCALYRTQGKHSTQRWCLCIVQ